tara:strand:- start:5519 stop:5992 length:474 start_codon:yes stop_codon:yes gene_type:complete
MKAVFVAALKKSDRSPPYVETLPKRGYRLLRPVELHKPAQQALIAPVNPVGRFRPWYKIAGGIALAIEVTVTVLLTVLLAIEVTVTVFQAGMEQAGADTSWVRPVFDAFGDAAKISAALAALEMPSRQACFGETALTHHAGTLRRGVFPWHAGSALS